ncbi:hypothetical protein HYY69_07125 [Candidatus Woesearchaeota archaeon]|nr:hypothetical protein [Candidatus Woesearchaeota archaeon]
MPIPQAQRRSRTDDSQRSETPDNWQQQLLRRQAQAEEAGARAQRDSAASQKRLADEEAEALKQNKPSKWQKLKEAMTKQRKWFWQKDNKPQPPIIGQKKTTRGLLYFTYALAISYYFMFYVTGNSTTLYVKLGVNFILGLFVVLTASDLEKRNMHQWFGAIILVEIILPVVYNLSGDIRNIDWITKYIINPYLFPLWMFYVIFNRDQNSDQPTNFGTILIIFWIILLFFGITSIAQAKTGIGSLKAGVSQTAQGEQLKATAAVYGEGLGGVFGFFKAFWNSITDFSYKMTVRWQNTLSYATGEQYSGEQQKSGSSEPVGIHIKNMKPGADLFRKNEHLFVTAALSANKLTMPSGEVLVQCYEGKKDASFEKGTTKEGKEIIDYGLVKLQTQKPAPERLTKDFPEEKDRLAYYKLIEGDEKEIKCRFPEGLAKFNKASGSQQTFTVNFEAFFPYETTSEKVIYFIDRDRFLSYRDETGEARLEKLKDDTGIDSFDTKAVYSPGPIELGQPDKSLIPIHEATDEEDATFFTVAGTLSNNQFGWDGKLKKITNIKIAIPKGTSLIETGTGTIPKTALPSGESTVKSEDLGEATIYECSHLFKKNDQNADECPEEEFTAKGGVYRSCSYQYENDGDIKECIKDDCKKLTTEYNVYNLRAELYTDTLVDIKDFVTFSCSAKVDKISDVLEESKTVTKKKIIIKAQYWYEISESTQVAVKQPQTPGMNVVDTTIEKTKKPGPSMEVEHKVETAQNVKVE